MIWVFSRGSIEEPSFREGHRCTSGECRDPSSISALLALPESGSLQRLFYLTLDRQGFLLASRIARAVDYRWLPDGRYRFRPRPGEYVLIVRAQEGDSWEFELHRISLVLSQGGGEICQSSRS